MLSRLGEVAVGCGAAVIVLWLLLPRAAAVVLRTTGDRVHRAIGELEAARDAGGADGASGEVLRRRRDLQFELHGNQYAAEDAAHDRPGGPPAGGPGTWRSSPRGIRRCPGADNPA